mmetsp:Transcript_1337/g.5437  ORF Transcript_1337/g.5437 Transcript_1337/m.5437 type:complete len:256 (+) Transcript_1337:138-905(+)
MVPQSTRRGARVEDAIGEVARLLPSRCPRRRRRKRARVRVGSARARSGEGESTRREAPVARGVRHVQPGRVVAVRGRDVRGVPGGRRRVRLRLHPRRVRGGLREGARRHFTGGDVAERTGVLLAPRDAPAACVPRDAQVPSPLQIPAAVGRPLHPPGGIVRLLRDTVLAGVLRSVVTGGVVLAVHVHHGRVRGVGPLRGEDVVASRDVRHQVSRRASRGVQRELRVSVSNHGSPARHVQGVVVASNTRSVSAGYQ